MDGLERLIPNSVSALIGLIVIMFFVVMFKEVAAKAGEFLWKKWIHGGKEKRHDVKEYQGIERRQVPDRFEKALTDLLETLNENNRQFREFISKVDASHFEIKESVDEIKRQQKSNWHRLFSEELASLRERFNGK